jgi:hypothetical protein
VDSELSPQEEQSPGLSPTEPGAAPSGGPASPGPAADHPGVTQPGTAHPVVGYPAAGQPTVTAYPGAAGPPPAGGYYPPAGEYPAPQPQYPYHAPPYPYPGPAQPGYPGGPSGAPGVPWPAAATPPPRRRRRRGLMLALTAAVAAVVGAAAAGVVLLGKSESPTEMALQSGRAIAPAQGLTFTGTIAGQNANLTVTRAGTVEGSYTQNGNPVTRITINHVTYVKAPTAFWKSVVIDPDSAQQAGGNWAKARGSAVIMGFDSLTPGQVARVLEHVGTSPRAVDATLGGTKVIKLTDHGTVYYITTAAPNRLLRIDGSSGATRYSFDVTSLTAASISPVFTILHGDVQALQGAVDPEAIVLPVQKIRFHSDCNGAVSCTVSGQASVTDPTTPTILLKMTVDFSGTKNGAVFASCHDTVPVAQGGTAAAACGLGGPVWSGWVNSHTSNFFTWARAQYEATVNSAGDITRLQDELDQQQKA